MAEFRYRDRASYRKPEKLQDAISIGDIIMVPDSFKYYNDVEGYKKGRRTRYMVTRVYKNFVILKDLHGRTLTLDYGDLVLLGYVCGGGFLDAEMGITNRRGGIKYVG